MQVIPRVPRHLVGLDAKTPLALTTAVITAETLVLRFGVAARHGARLLVSAAVFAAICRSSLCVGGASFRRAYSMSAVFNTDATCFRKRGAAFLRAHSLAAAAVLAAPASSFDGSGAIGERTALFGSMFTANPAC